MKEYGDISGQMINFEKCQISFSPNVFKELKQHIVDTLGVNTVETPSKYLGLLTVVGKSKKQILSLIKEKIRRKLNGWKERLLSFASREVLIKAVAQSIPTYIMSIFKLPTTL